MTILIIVLIVIILIAVFRFGMEVEYSDDGLRAKVRAGFLSFKIYPLKDKDVEILKITKAIKDVVKKPGSIDDFNKIIIPVKNALSRIKRRLLIKYLEIRYTAASDDPANTALSFGVANAAIDMIMPIFVNNFRIKKCETQVTADFESRQQKIYLNLVISIAVWEAIYILWALLPILKPNIPETKKRPNSSIKSEVL